MLLWSSCQLSAVLLPFPAFLLPFLILAIAILSPPKSQPLSQALWVQVSRKGISLRSAHWETSLLELLNYWK